MNALPKGGETSKAQAPEAVHRTIMTHVDLHQISDVLKTTFHVNLRQMS